CVIDEYGGFAGVLTIEDLAEELVGEITDEHDDDEDIAGVHDQEDGVWLMDGDVHVDEVERTIGRDMLLPRGDYETLAGLLIAEGGNLPEVGDTVRIDLAVFGADLMEDEPPRPSLEVEVLEVDRHVPSELRIRLHENSPDGSEPSAESDEDTDR
ncbi:transporter associated domain-containing protein, partial [Rhodococcus sp. EPR-147]